MTDIQSKGRLTVSCLGTEFQGHSGVGHRDKSPGKSSEWTECGVKAIMQFSSVITRTKDTVASTGKQNKEKLSWRAGPKMTGGDKQDKDSLR
jgi:hypothetical protein